MKQAADAGNINAVGNLGVYYVRGFGAKPDARAAVALFKQGSEQHNAACLFFYAQCSEQGLGGLRPNLAVAKEFYRNSAVLGFIPAMQWCGQHNVAFEPNR